MKKIYNYAFHLVCIYLLVLCIFSFLNVEITIINYKKVIHNNNEEKALESAILVKDTKMHSQDAAIYQGEIDNSIVANEIENKREVETEESAVNMIDTSNYSVISSENVNISHYGHDCIGCSTGLTASGYYVGDGRIYYNDSTFGSVRIVAADRKYPLGTVIRLSYSDNSYYAIVLDRGGAIGDHSKYQIDLLASSEKVSYELGVIYNAYLEVLRLGY